jgi:hypothetical protein
MINVAILRLDNSDSNFSTLKKQYKVSRLESNEPKMRFYPNVKFGQKKKVEASTQIMFDALEETVDKIKSQVLELFFTEIESISAGDFNNVIVKYAKDE